MLCLESKCVLFLTISAAIWLVFLGEKIGKYISRIPFLIFFAYSDNQQQKL